MDVNLVLGLLSEIRSRIEQIERTIVKNPQVNIRVNSPGATIKVGDDHFRTMSMPQAPDFVSLIMSPDWPEAVPGDLLCDLDNERDLIDYAEGFLDATIDVPTEGKRFLDYGCGNGYMANQMLRRGVSSSTGYDIVDPGWRFQHNATLTTQHDSLEENAFDIILLCDVLDHAENPPSVLADVHRLLAPGGVVYVHTHPWTSRTGGHLYRSLNKAYAHLVLGPRELASMGIESIFCQHIFDPLKTYRDWFTHSGFVIRRSEEMIEGLESFLKTDVIWHRLLSSFLHLGSLNTKDISHILEVQGVDYTLEVEKTV